MTDLLKWRQITMLHCNASRVMDSVLLISVPASTKENANPR